MQRKNSVHDEDTLTFFRKANQDGGGVKSKKKGLACGKSWFVVLFWLVILLLSAPCLALTTDLTSERRLATLFIQITSGTCTSSGRWMVKNIIDCALGRQELGGSVLSAIEISRYNVAPACSQSASGTDLTFNIGGDYDFVTHVGCSQNQQCICWTGSECANKYGEQPNTNECMCGTKICIRHDDGIYCTASFSSCTIETTLFIKISSGTCTSSGHWMIKNIFDCALGHQAFGGTLLSATPLSSNYFAPACSQTPSGTYLRFNTGAANNFVTADPCSQYEYCICWTGSECANKDGAQPNTNQCMCGTNICIPEVDGTYCVASSSSCTIRPGITCPVYDASSANTNSCRCGSNDCMTGNGGQPYCIDSLNFCGTSCDLGKYRNVATSGGW